MIWVVPEREDMVPGTPVIGVILAGTLRRWSLLAVSLCSASVLLWLLSSTGLPVSWYLLQFKLRSIADAFV
jgi:hypothetical protein